MREKPYYSVRTGKREIPKLSLEDLKNLFMTAYRNLVDDGYFQEAFGYDCVDNGEVDGALGPTSSISARLFMVTGKKELWPIYEHYERYTEDDLFDMIEFLFDQVSKGIDGYYHNFCDCGWHYSKFNKQQGEELYRLEVNAILKIYNEGYELSEAGEILSLPPVGFEKIHDAPLPVNDPENINDRLTFALNSYRKARTCADKKPWIVELANILEHIDKDRIRKLKMSPDDAELVTLSMKLCKNTVNNFDMRHHNNNQKTGYHKPAWYAWMFYTYLATIYALLNLIDKYEN